MSSCREVVETLSADELERRRIGYRLLIRLHLFRCRDCRRYLEQLFRRPTDVAERRLT